MNSVGRFPSGQREQTVNLLATLSVVRIHPLPPTRQPNLRIGLSCLFLSINQKFPRTRSKRAIGAKRTAHIARPITLFPTRDCPPVFKEHITRRFQASDGSAKKSTRPRVLSDCSRFIFPTVHRAFCPRNRMKLPFPRISCCNPDWSRDAERWDNRCRS